MPTVTKNSTDLREKADFFCFIISGFILAIKGRLSLVVNKTKDLHFELKRVNFYPVSLSVTLK